MRKTPHTRLNKSAFKQHYGREPNTEISILLYIDALKKLTRTCISAKPTPYRCIHSTELTVPDQLPMKQKKGAKGNSSYPFVSHEKKMIKPKFDSAYSDKIHVAVSGTNHTVTTADNRNLNRKHISKPISEITQEPNNRGTGPLGPDVRFTKSHLTFLIHDSDSEFENTEPESPVKATPKESGTLGRGRQNLSETAKAPEGHRKQSKHKQPLDQLQ